MKFFNPKSNGRKFYQAQYELGESYYQNQEFCKSQIGFKIANAQNDYQEDAQVRIAQILLSENNFSGSENLFGKSRQLIKCDD